MATETSTTTDRPDAGSDAYQLGYAEQALRQIIDHYDRGDDVAHSIDVARRFLGGAR